MKGDDRMLQRAIALAWIAVCVGVIAFLAGQAHQRSADRSRKFEGRVLDLELEVNHLRAQSAEPAEKR